MPENKIAPDNNVLKAFLIDDFIVNLRVNIKCSILNTIKSIAQQKCDVNRDFILSDKQYDIL